MGRDKRGRTMKRSFNVSIKRSKNYQSVEVSLGFEGDMTEKDFLNECNSSTQAAKERAQKELDSLDNDKINLNLR